MLTFQEAQHTGKKGVSCGIILEGSHVEGHRWILRKMKDLPGRGLVPAVPKCLARQLAKEVHLTSPFDSSMAVDNSLSLVMFPRTIGSTPILMAIEPGISAFTECDHGMDIHGSYGYVINGNHIISRKWISRG